MSFALDLSRLVAKANGRTELVVRKVMLETFKGCISKSPVDTGRFRGAWVVGIGSINSVTPDRIDKRKVGDKSGKTIDAMTYDISAMRLHGDVTVYLTNAMSYAQQLEYGYSKQSPAGMVRVTLAEITSHYGT